MTLTAEQLEHVVQRLEGQCMLTLETVLEDMGLAGRESDSDVCEQVDAAVFCCDGCGWWCLIEELNDGQLCDDCNE